MRQTGYLPRPHTSTQAPEIFACGVVSGYISSFMKIGRGVSELWRVENRPLPLTWPMAYTTACTTVQAVIHIVESRAVQIVQSVLNFFEDTLVECQLNTFEIIQSLSFHLFISGVQSLCKIELTQNCMKKQSVTQLTAPLLTLHSRSNCVQNVHTFVHTDVYVALTNINVYKKASQIQFRSNSKNADKLNVQ